MKYSSLTLCTLIANDALRLLVFCFVVACGMMVTHGPEANEFVLRWDVAKFVAGGIGGMLASFVLGIFRVRQWSRSRSALLQRMAETPPETWRKQYRDWRRKLDLQD